MYWKTVDDAESAKNINERQRKYTKKERRRELTKEKKGGKERKYTEKN